MTNEPHLRVGNPPPKPLMIWDGDCHFCKRWIERWREITAGKVDYCTYQETSGRFPEVPVEQFKRAVAFIEPDGKTFFAAEAVYRSLRSRSSRKWLAWSYDHVPGFAVVSELAYKFIARHRKLGSAITRLLWGKDVRPPTYFWARRWFLRALGLIYLIAFVSFWVQVDGLIGSNGILPVSQFLPAAHQQLGRDAYCLLPTLCWFNSGNTFLHFLCGGGVVFSLLLIAGIIPIVSLIALFAFYLSLTLAGQTFLGFQWDILLIETGFLSIFLAPWQLVPKREREPPISRAALFLLKLLLFKLLLMSGVVKLTSGDDCWWNLTALDYHYWSQPLPTVFGWWGDLHPEWFKKFSVAFCLTVEIIAPFFIWAPRRLKLIAVGLIVFLQIAIAVTGNYCFFNLLTIALCLLLIDDASIGQKYASTVDRRNSYGLPIYGAIAVIIITLPVNAWLIFTAFKPEAVWPRSLSVVYEHLEAFRIVNSYGLFRVMTRDRREIVIEGSADGVDWLPYELKWKPGDVKRAPGWCAPHQPRLDWQMWFAALGSARDRVWFEYLVARLLEGEPDVTRLFARNPFPQGPPRYIRAVFYRYRFTTADEHRQTGAWWRRQELGEYFPTVSLQQLR
jgi:predicted DCC family thiol-disulfide oxidoreductase YuxK